MLGKKYYRKEVLNHFISISEKACIPLPMSIYKPMLEKEINSMSTAGLIVLLEKSKRKISL